MQTQPELDYKQILAEYHRSLMRIRWELNNAKNEQPGQKDQAAKDAGMDFSALVGNFEEKYGRLL